MGIGGRAKARVTNQDAILGSAGGYIRQPIGSGLPHNHRARQLRAPPIRLRG
ncbi:hypothetical protein chiPu_0028301, partial [Chiloscyllium punctatum]|nr:hypothetical protein [Chiloscyllium punctatum]